MDRARGRDNGPVGAIHQANAAGGELGKGMQEGKVTRVEVEGDLLQMTGHVWVISPVEDWEGRKFESHDILGYDVRRLQEGVTKKREGRGEGEGSEARGEGCGTSSRSRNEN
jgi:hypothetical protein